MTPGGPRVRAGAAFGGRFSPPGDKSVTHRAYLFGLLADGETHVRGVNAGEDCARSLAAANVLGGTGRREGDAAVVRGTAMSLRQPADAIDCGNSGTSMRLLAGVLSGVPGLSVLTGDASLRRRPVRRVIDPLRRMGADLSARDGDRLPPLVVRGRPLRGARHLQKMASAQVKSALLLADLAAEGKTTVVEPERSHDHTERMLLGMGVPVRVDGLSVTVSPARPRGTRVDVPGDISSAAFFLCAAAGLPGSEVTVRNLGVNPTRTGLLEVLASMGAEVRLEGERELAGERRAEVTVRAKDLTATEIAGPLIPRLIDELPVLMVLATQARGRTVIRDARELRVKESDRLAAMGETLSAAGARIELFDDGCAILGPTRLRGVAVKTRLDHRIAMSMAVAQLLAGPAEETVLDDVACVDTSFPSFFELLDSLAPGGRGSALP